LTDISDSGAVLVSPIASAPGADTDRRSNTPNAADKNLFFDIEKTSSKFVLTNKTNQKRLL